MVRIRTLVPLTHPTTEENFGTDTEVDVADDVAATWHAQGKATYIDDEKASEASATPGHYNDVTGRDDAAPLTPGGSQPGPQAEEDDEDDAPKSRRSKK